MNRPNYKNVLAACAGALALTGSAVAQISFGPGQDYFPGAEPEGLASGDFNGDGDMDWAVTSDAPDKISIYTGTGNGTFTGPVQVFLGGGVSAQALVAGDFDGDGDTDLAVSLKNSNAVQLVFNNGGSFSPGASTGTGGSEPRHLALGDLDGDGDLDIVASNRESNNVSVLTNQGGSLSLLGTFGAGQEPRYVELADLDGDGDLDAAVAAHDSRSVQILLGTGSGSLTSGPTLSVGSQLRPDGIAAADLDGDGDVDLAAATSGNGQGFVSVFVNQGSGWTGPSNFTSGGQNPEDIVAADFDLDGDVDLATSNQDLNTIATLANSGAASFGMPQLMAAGTGPGDLETADFDGNGSADLAVANRDSNDVTVYLNDAQGDTGVGTDYCDSNPNSTGLTAALTASGSAVVAANNVQFSMSNLPPNQFGYLLMSDTQGFVPLFGGSEGNLCLGGSIVRFAKNILNSGASGSTSFQPDLTNLPQGTMIQPGQTWSFQYWTRDASANNTSNGRAIAFQ